MKPFFFDWLDNLIIDFSKSNVRNFIVNIPKHPKRAIIMVSDFCLLSFSLWLSLSLRFNTFYLPENIHFFFLLISAPVIGILTFFLLGVYKTVTRFIIASDIIRIHFAIIISIIIWGVIIYIFRGENVFPRSTPLSYGLFSILLVWFSRWIASYFLKGQEHFISDAKISKNVIIYGAGITGTQLAEKLSKHNEFRVRGFIDDNPALWKRRIMGHKIHSPDFISTLLKNHDIKDVILALPRASISERKKIIRFLEPYPMAVHTLPAVEDIVSGRVSVGDLKLVGVEDLLGREPVPPYTELLEQIIVGKTVFITGAGGSIGSELSRQIFKSKPKTLILFDISEAALYLIEQNLFDYQKQLTSKNEGTKSKRSYQDISIIPIIGSVLDQSHVERIMEHYQIETIFHAAAYKHVPLVESNPMIGIKNNLWGTKIVSDAALKHSVERMVLISTDKAVRPTNIMGASKRLSEMYLQALNDQQKHSKNLTTIFTMVRFGNVLDSSGSVVKKFKKQIRQGGPVTVTDPDIIRYFMSIPEAAELVIQAGAMAQGGEVYVLDMGEAIKIRHLAETMIRLMGLEVKNQGNPDGDIEIQFTGLRSGEKLFEEFFIDEHSAQTKHPRILKNNEDFLAMDSFQKSLENLENVLQNNDIDALYKLLKILVSGYVPSTEIKNWKKH